MNFADVMVVSQVLNLRKEKLENASTYFTRDLKYEFLVLS